MITAPTLIQIQLGEHGYPIHVGRGLLRESALMQAVAPKGRILIVSNETVASLHLGALQASLAGREVAVCLLPDGEAYKTLTTLEQVYDQLATARINRDGVIFALGGGVVGDIAGFAAATWHRGIDCVQVPTTLLSQVDSSVGGKTAVNHAQGKNLIGAFHQPKAVIADLETLATLPDREYSAGLAEVIKYGLIRDVEFLVWLENTMPRLLKRDYAVLQEAVSRSCAHKAAIVALDEREAGVRALLNFGHTFGHAIENAVGYGQCLHGEAVAIGMVLAAETSERLGWIDAASVTRIRNLLSRAGLPVNAPRIGVTRARELMELDKKVQAGKVRLVLLKQIGDAVVTADYDNKVLDAVLEERMA